MSIPKDDEIVKVLDKFHFEVKQKRTFFTIYFITIIFCRECGC